MSHVLHPAFAGPTREQIAEADADFQNTVLARTWLRENYNPLSSDDDRALEERLSVSVRMCDWRAKACLPAHPPREAVLSWRRRVAELLSLGGYRRRHPNVSPINPTAA